MSDPRVRRDAGRLPVGRRRLLGGVAAASVPGAVGPAAGRTPRPDPEQRSGATFRWLGTSGWRVDIGARTLLVDPYLTRFDTGLFSGRFDPATPLRIDAAAIREHAGTPETILVTHSHWDHLNDVPHIAATSQARVIGTLTTYHLALALGVPAAQLAPVEGGEVLAFGQYQVEVVASLHSRNVAYSIAFPGVRHTPLPPDLRPATVSDLPEGGTLAFHLRISGGPSVFLMGASDFVARNLHGLAPDIAMIAVAASDATHAYLPRILDALDRPSVVVPVHWDNFETPLRNPPPTTPDGRRRLDDFIAAVRSSSPRSRIVVPDYLTPYTFS